MTKVTLCAQDEDCSENETPHFSPTPKILIIHHHTNIHHIQSSSCCSTTIHNHQSLSCNIWLLRVFSTLSKQKILIFMKFFPHEFLITSTFFFTLTDFKIQHSQLDMDKLLGHKTKHTQTDYFLFLTNQICSLFPDLMHFPQIP